MNSLKTEEFWDESQDGMDMLDRQIDMYGRSVKSVIVNIHRRTGTSQQKVRERNKKLLSLIASGKFLGAG